MCIENNAFYRLQIIEDKRTRLIPLSEEDKQFYLNNNMQERIDSHDAYIKAFMSVKEIEQNCRERYGDDIIDKLMRGMPLS